jgi:hypothetical protein
MKKPKKPDKVKLGHREYKIKYITNKEASKRQIYGEVDTNLQIIVVDQSLDKLNTSNTILHEVMHILAYNYQWNLPAKTEELIAETSVNGLMDCFAENPEILKYIYNSFKK